MYGQLVLVYEGDRFLGEAELHLQKNVVVLSDDLKEIRISRYSQPSERCPPLALLHTMNPAGICFKLESTAKNQESPLSVLHATCLRDNKTAVIFTEDKEIHLVAMHSRNYDAHLFPCFWGFNVYPKNLYDSCLNMLNLRCLGIVFDLDETLIVANTMRSFEDRIEALQRKINSEADPHRSSSMVAEVKRYQEDKNILTQYIENDEVAIENGKVIKSQAEVVLALSDNHQTIVRPIIRLQDRNIIMTRINPQIRDTSVLVRLRPAWEELRSYLTARGRKRFEVFVCTKAERDYALEMWRLLDPEGNLIDLRQLLERIVCVKSSSRKALSNVFQVGNCHPSMALVIDDRLEVWDEKDQPRVHMVPAFAPYYVPQAEANNTVAVLCVARNVACKVRGGFFKEFDEGLLKRISEIAYEDDIKMAPTPPDVSNYLVSEKDPSTLTGTKDFIGFDGMADAEVERRLKEAISASSTAPSPVPNFDPQIAPSLKYTVPPIQGAAVSLPLQVATLLKPQPLSQSSPAREEGEVPESELDPDTRRRLLILQHGQDVREPNEAKFTSGPPVQVSVPRVDNSIPPGGRVLCESQSLPRETLPREDLLGVNQPVSDFHSFPGEDVPASHLSSPKRSLDLESGQIDPDMETPVGILRDIAFKCGTKLEFKIAMASSTDLQFSVEVFFAGEKVGEGFSRTRRDAQRQAAERSLLYLADTYLSQLNNMRFEASKKSLGSIDALNELCALEGLSMAFQTQPQFSPNSHKNEVYAQVEINGEMLGKGIGQTWDEAKSQAAEYAMLALKSMFGQLPYRRQGSPRSMQGMPNKRLKPDFSQVLQRIPSSTRYPKNASLVP